MRFALFPSSSFSFSLVVALLALPLLACTLPEDSQPAVQCELFNDTCSLSGNGVCDVGNGCAPGTDDTDCGTCSETEGGKGSNGGGNNGLICSDTCQYAKDGICDIDNGFCEPGTDDTDCNTCSVDEEKEDEGGDNNDNPDENPDTSPGGEFSACSCGETGGAEEFRYHPCLQSGCGAGLTCFADVGSGEGTCRYPCDASEVSTSGSCPSIDYFCANSPLRTVQGETIYLCFP